MKYLILLLISISVLISCKDEKNIKCALLLNMEIRDKPIKGNPMKGQFYINNLDACCQSSVPLYFSVENGDGIVICNKIVYKQGYLFDYNNQLTEGFEFEYIPLTLGTQSLSFSINTNSGLITQTRTFGVFEPLLDIHMPNLPDSMQIYRSYELKLDIDTNLNNLKLEIQFMKGHGTVLFNKNLIVDVQDVEQIENIVTIIPKTLGEVCLDFNVFNSFGISKHYIVEFISVY